MVDQLNAFAGEVTRWRARWAARAPGRPATFPCCRHLEGPDGFGEFDGRQPDGSGAQHCEVTTAVAAAIIAQNHRGCEGRNPGAEEHHQHHGRPAQRFRRRSYSCGARGRHGWQAGRTGAGARRCRTWKDLTDNVNFMASNLTGQVRNIAR